MTTWNIQKSTHECLDYIPNRTLVSMNLFIYWFIYILQWHDNKQLVPIWPGDMKYQTKESSFPSTQIFINVFLSIIKTSALCTKGQMETLKSKPICMVVDTSDWEWVYQLQGD